MNCMKLLEEGMNISRMCGACNDYMYNSEFQDGPYGFKNLVIKRYKKFIRKLNKHIEFKSCLPLQDFSKFVIPPYAKEYGEVLELIRNELCEACECLQEEINKKDLIIT